MSSVIWTHHMCSHNQQLHSASNVDRQLHGGPRVSDVNFGLSAHSVPDTDVWTVLFGNGHSDIGHAGVSGQPSLDTDIRTSVIQVSVDSPPWTRTF